MITFLSVLSSVAVIVYSVIAYAQYRSSNTQHRERLRIEYLLRRRQAFGVWVQEYLHLTQVLVNASVQLDMDMLEDGYHGVLDDASEVQRRKARIAENSRSRDRNQVDLNYQMMMLNLVIDERKPYFKEASAKIRENYQEVHGLLQGFEKLIFGELLPQMTAPEIQTVAQFSEIMAEAREKARDMNAQIEQSNHTLGEQVREDSHAMDDEVEGYF
ncbi:MAG: hypothetical protein LBI43_06580 [Streptococcaceae bacterium]|jgi:hypothetical protein|nr:hypothetical protein [Streptococcaceae bacterium]